MAATKVITVFSPHLDDAVFDCTDHMLKWANQGWRVKVVTVFTSFAAPGLSRGAEKYMRESGYDDVALYEQGRKQEDVKALELLGLEWEHLDLVDGGYRYAEGEVVYPGFREIVSGQISEKDRPLHSVLQEVLLAHGSERVCIPLGVGNHVDHLLVRMAAEAAFPRRSLAYYLDYPYALWKRNWDLPALWRIVTSRKRSIERYSSIKGQASQCYTSQYPMFFKEPPGYVELVCSRWKS